MPTQKRKPFIETFSTAIMCCTYDDEVWDLVKLGLSLGDEKVKKLATELQGMNVEQAQKHLKAHT